PRDAPFLRGRAAASPRFGAAPRSLRREGAEQLGAAFVRRRARLALGPVEPALLRRARCRKHRRRAMLRRRAEGRAGVPPCPKTARRSREWTRAPEPSGWPSAARRPSSSLASPIEL